MEAKKCSSVIRRRLIKHLFLKCKFASSIWSIIQIGSTLYPARSVANIFVNWLNGVDHRFKRLIRVGAIAVIWSLWLCRNDKVFNDKNSSLTQIIYRSTATLRSWSLLQRVEHHDLFTEVCTKLEDTARDFLSQHGWQHNLRIGPPLS